MRNRIMLQFPNAAAPESDGLVAAINAVAMPEGGAPEWLEIPYADVPYAFGGVSGIQRLNLDVARKIVAVMARAVALDSRLAAGLPFYVGHPDFVNGADAAAARRWMQQQPPAFGWIREFRAGAGSLGLRVEWTEEGAALVNSRKYKFFSPFFRSAEVGEENGVRIYEPRLIQSAGLTNTPNWPMPPMVNAALTGGGETEEGSMTLLQRLVALLGDDKITSDDDVVNAVQNLITAAKAIRESVEAHWDAEDAARKAVPNAGAPLALAAGYIAHASATIETLNARAALVDGLQAQLAAAVKAHAATLVNAAVARGAVLQDHAESRIADLANAGDAFGDKAKELAALPRLMSTESKTRDIATRSTETAGRRARFQELVNARIAERHTDYDTAFAAVAAEHPELLKSGGPEA